MGPDSSNMQENAGSLYDEAHKQTFHGTYSKGSSTRHARWSRQETIVLIQAKLATENRIGSTASYQIEPKWDSVSSYCKQHGIGREPVQCQKRWSNLLRDFRKIKTWELHMKEAESFWTMRSNLRRERKLPGLFDREVYDILDGKGFAMEATPLAQVIAMTEIDNCCGDRAAIVADQEKQENKDEEAEKEIGQGNKKRTITIRSPVKTVQIQTPISGEEAKEKCPGSIAQTGCMIRKGPKRRRLSTNGSEDNNLAKILERNSNMLSSQLESQNINYQLDRDQRKEQADSLLATLNKLTDALVKIANKL